MGILDIFKSKPKQQQKSAPMSLFFNNGTGMSIVSKTDAIDFYTSWVFACIDRRSNGLAAIEFKLYQMSKKGEVEEILEHELLELLYRVNQGMTKFDFIKLSIIYNDIFGASPWLLEGGKKGAQPTDLYVLRPEFLAVRREKRTGKVLGYTYQIGDFKRDYEPEEIIFLKNYNPADPNKGLGIVEAARLAAQHNDYIGQYNTKLLENGARPSGVLEVEGTLEDDQRDRLKKQVKKRYQGYDKAYEMMILEGGMKYNPIQLPPKDLEFLEAKQMNRDEIMAIFGVSKPILAIFDDINRASALTAEYLFAKHTLEPLATKYVEQLNEFLVPRYGDNLWLSFEPLARDDDDTLTKKKEAAWNKWKTTNEIRSDEGLDPIAGGDSIYMGMSNMPYMNDGQQNNNKKGIIIGGEAFTAKVDAKTAKDIKRRILNRNVRLKKHIAEASKKVVDQHIAKKKIVLKIVPEKKSKKELSQEQIDAFYKIRMEDEPQLENLWQKRFEEFFEGQKQRFLEAIDSKKDAVKDYDIDVEQELKATIDIINPLMWETFMKGTQHAGNLIGEATIMDMDFVKEWLAGVSEKTGEQITNTTIEAFEKTMKEAAENGESIAETKVRIEELFEFAKNYRSELIARTETARGVTEAHRKMYEHYGFTDVKWLLSPGACEECAAKASDKWTVKSIEGQIPVHPNCKCDHTPI